MVLSYEYKSRICHNSMQQYHIGNMYFTLLKCLVCCCFTLLPVKSVPLPKTCRLNHRTRVSLQVSSLMVTRCCNQLCSLWKLWKLAVARSLSMWRILRDTKRRQVMPDRHGGILAHKMPIQIIWLIVKVLFNPLLPCPLLLQAKVKPNKDKNRTYTVTYVPKVEGVHKVKQSCIFSDVHTSLSTTWTSHSI